MLFNSYVFLLAFLPVTLIGFFWLGLRSLRFALAWLAAASLFFYGWWNPAFVVLILMSVVFNYFAGSRISAANGKGSIAPARAWLTFAIGINLAALAYFKYATFLLLTAKSLTGFGWTIPSIALPVGISFFTFTQIAFLVDAYRGRATEFDFLRYLLFVSYFPHLIAGPILHHGEMMPQFARPGVLRFSSENMAVGFTLFLIGLAKKVLLADHVSAYVTPVFDTPLAAHASMLDAWTGVLAYAFQIYFDFSGYSDMAIGLSLLFNVRLPINFDSPYKARSIIDFWRRWHITLSRFLRDYLYFALGGNRKGLARRHVNLMVTMLLGGLWHGAAWTYVVWGGLHGIYLVINHGWRELRQRLHWTGAEDRWYFAWPSWLLTFIVVLVGWVFFRAPNFRSALGIVEGMFGVNGTDLPEKWLPKLHALGPVLQHAGVRFVDTMAFTGTTELLWLVTLLLIAVFAPNTRQLFAAFKPMLAESARTEAPVVRGWSLSWSPSVTWAAIAAAAGYASITLLGNPGSFLYYQF